MKLHLHLFKLSYWAGGPHRFFVGDIDALGGQGNQWWCAARLLGLSLDRFLAFLVTKGATIWDARHGQVLYYFENETKAKEYCEYINRKAKNIGFYV